MKRILITGGTGFIGSRLCQMATDAGYQVIVYSRQPAIKVKQLCGENVKVLAQLEQLPSIEPVDFIINLAGEPILAGRWSTQRKHVLRQSRIDLTRQLINTLARMPVKPKAMISGSAIGYYGEMGDVVCDESMPAASDYAAQLCRDWEQSARAVTALKTRLCIIRIGIVLDPAGGPLQKMLLPFKWGMGGKIGTGKQWFSWITRDDLCRSIFFLMNNAQCQGVFNVCAPEPVRNESLTAKLGQKLNRPTFVPVPELALKALLGEASHLLLASQRVAPRALVAAGFEFNSPTLEHALRNLP